MYRLADGIPEGVLLMLGSQAGELGEDHVGDGQDEHPRHHQVQVGGILHSRHARSVVEVGAELGVDGEIDGLHPGGHHHRPHQGEGLAHSLRTEGEVGVIVEIQLPQTGHLNQGLEQPPHQIGSRQSVYTKVVIQKEKVADDNQIGHGTNERRDIEAVHGLQNSHKGEGHPGKEHGREHGPGEGGRQGRRLSVIPVSKQGDQGLGKDHAQYREHRGKQGHHRQEVPAKTKGLFLSFLREILAEDRNKTGRNRGGKHHIKKDPGDAAGDVKCLGLHPGGAVMHRHQMVPVQPQHFAQQGNCHNHTNSFCGIFVVFCQAFLSFPRAKRPSLRIIALFYTKHFPFSTVLVPDSRLVHNFLCTLLPPGWNCLVSPIESQGHSCYNGCVRFFRGFSPIYQ